MKFIFFIDWHDLTYLYNVLNYPYYIDYKIKITIYITLLDRPIIIIRNSWRYSYLILITVFISYLRFNYTNFKIIFITDVQIKRPHFQHISTITLIKLIEYILLNYMSDYVVDNNHLGITKCLSYQCKDDQFI